MPFTASPDTGGDAVFMADPFNIGNDQPPSLFFKMANQCGDIIIRAPDKTVIIHGCDEPGSPRNGRFIAGDGLAFVFIPGKAEPLPDLPGQGILFEGCSGFVDIGVIGRGDPVFGPGSRRESLMISKRFPITGVRASAIRLVSL